MNVILGIVAMILATGLALSVIKMLLDMATGSCDDTDRKGWIRFDKKKPKESGWYLCTVEQGSRFPMLLYWDSYHYSFADPVRQSVFNDYEVMVTKKFEEGMETDAIMPNDEYMERIYRDEGCDRTKYVIAWKPEPKVFTGEVKNYRNTGMNRADFSGAAGIDQEAIDNMLNERIYKLIMQEKASTTSGLTLEQIDEIASEFNSLGNVNVVTPDELRAALINAETINLHGNGRN